MHGWCFFSVWKKIPNNLKILYINILRRALVWKKVLLSSTSTVHSGATAEMSKRTCVKCQREQPLQNKWLTSSFLGLSAVTQRVDSKPYIYIYIYNMVCDNQLYFNSLVKALSWSHSFELTGYNIRLNL